MVRLFLVRHGKTVWNNERRLQGAWGDSSLIKKDLDQIDRLGHRLKGIDFADFYSSPLKRAFKTSLRLAESMDYQRPIRIAESLREINFGKLEGKRDEDMPAEDQLQINYFFKVPEKYDSILIKGESYQEAAERSRQFVTNLVDTYPCDAKIILVSHGGILNVMINAMLNIPLSDYRKHGGIKNVSLTQLEVEPNYKTRVIDFNNVDHI